MPDICVVRAAPALDYLVDAAYLVVEVLSRRDSLNAMALKCREYAEKGVANIWVIDLRAQSVWVYREGALAMVDGDTVGTTDGTVEIGRGEIFAE